MAQGGRVAGGGPPPMDFGNMSQMLQFMMQYRQVQAGQQWEIMKSQAEDWIGPSGAGPSAFFRDNQAALKRQLSLTFGGGLGGRKRADQVFDQLLQGEMDFDQLSRLSSTAVARGWMAPEQEEAPAPSKGKQGETPAQTVSTETTKETPEGEKTVTKEVVTGYQYPQPEGVTVKTTEPLGTPEGGIRANYERGAIGARPHGAAQDYTQDEIERRAALAKKGGWDGTAPKPYLNADDFKAEVLYPKYGAKSEKEIKQKIYEANQAGDTALAQEMLRALSPSGVLNAMQSYNQQSGQAFEAAVQRGQELETQPGARGQARVEKEVTVPEYEGPYGEFLVQNKQAQTKTVTETVPSRKNPLAPGAQTDAEELKEAVREAAPDLDSGVRGKIEGFIEEVIGTGGNLSTGQQQTMAKAAKVMWKGTGEGPMKPEVAKDVAYFLNFIQEHSGAASVADNPVVADIMYSAAKNADRTLTMQENQNRINMLEATINYADYLRKSDPNNPEYKLEAAKIEFALKSLGIQAEMNELDLNRAKLSLRIAEINLDKLLQGGDIPAGVTKEQVEIWKRSRAYFDKNPIDERYFKNPERFERWAAGHPEEAARWRQMEQIETMMYQGMAGFGGTAEEELTEEQQALEDEYSF